MRVSFFYFTGPVWKVLPSSSPSWVWHGYLAYWQSMRVPCLDKDGIFYPSNYVQFLSHINACVFLLLHHRSGVKGLAILLPILGVTWLFGILAIHESILFFEYLFNIFNCLQGFFIFIFHCVGSSEVRGFKHILGWHIFVMGANQKPYNLACWCNRGSHPISSIQSRKQQGRDLKMQLFQMNLIWLLTTPMGKILVNRDRPHHRAGQLRCRALGL